MGAAFVQVMRAQDESAARMGAIQEQLASVMMAAARVEDVAGAPVDGGVPGKSERLQPEELFAKQVLKSFRV